MNDLGNWFIEKMLDIKDSDDWSYGAVLGLIGVGWLIFFLGVMALNDWLADGYSAAPGNIGILLTGLISVSLNLRSIHKRVKEKEGAVDDEQEVAL